MKLRATLTAIGIASLAMAAHNAQAAGFYIQEQSAKQQGDAFAGAAANPEDASILFNNPAGMTDLSGPQMTGNISLLMPDSSFSNRGSNLGGVIPTTGNNGGNPYSPTAVPSFYLATPIKNTPVWAGLAVTAPFGLSNDYGNTWVGRYNSTESVLQTIDIAPTVAVKMADGFSLGGGIDFQRAHAELDQAVPTGLPPSPDTFAEVSGNNWNVGYNVGVMWDVDQATRLGLHYRSAITQDIDGTLVVPGIVPAVGATAKVKLPDVLEFGATHQFTQQLKVLGSVNWFGWNKFNEIRVQDPTTPDIVTTTDWRDTFSVALGAEWQQNDKLTYRGGIQFDETPTADDRDTRVPDSNRFWLSVGASYNVTPAFTLDAAASHLFMPDAGVDGVDDLTGTPTNVIGVSSNQVNILSVGGTVKF